MQAFRAANPPSQTGLLYGLLIVFAKTYRPKNDPDADNLSKIVWDELEDLRAFEDDRQVRLRTAILLDLRLGDVPVPISTFSDTAIMALNKWIETSDPEDRWLTFIRYGQLETPMLEYAAATGRA